MSDETRNPPVGSVPLPTPTPTAEDHEAPWDREELWAKISVAFNSHVSTKMHIHDVPDGDDVAAAVMPVVDELRAEIDELQERVRIQHGINEDWVKYGQRVSAKRQSDVEEFESALGLEHAGRGYWYERMISAAQVVRTERDEALAELATTREKLHHLELIMGEVRELAEVDGEATDELVVHTLQERLSDASKKLLALDHPERPPWTPVRPVDPWDPQETNSPVSPAVPEDPATPTQEGE